jgi:cell volume regulation protein A
VPTELHATEVMLLAVGVLLLAGVLAGGLSRRAGVPVLVVFLAVGMLAGSEGIGGIRFEDYSLTYRIGTTALVLILFDGGLRTPVHVVRSAIGPAGVLATLGVALTAGATGVVAHALGFAWPQALVLGAIVSPTDAAAVFSMLRGGGVHLKERIGALVELESGLNDPMSVLLSIALVGAAAHGGAIHFGALGLHVAVELIIGATLGAAVGLGARKLLARMVVHTAGLYAAFVLSCALVAYGVASMLAGSGFLAAYVAGVLIGNARLPNRGSLLRIYDFVAWLGQIVMFVVLGLLSFPSRVLAIAPKGLVLAAMLAFVARPLAVAVCLVPFRFRLAEILLIGWVGLRGAVPIVLATMPVLARVDGGERIFDAVFFVVLGSALVQGSTARTVAERLHLAARSPPAQEALVEIEATRVLDEEVLSFFISPVSAVCGARIADIPFPGRSAAMLVVRKADLIAPRGDTVLRDGDHVFVFCGPDDVAMVSLLFGRPEI